MSLIQSDEERIQRLEKYVAKVEESIKDLEASVARGDMESLSIEEIQFYLSHCPDMCADAGMFYTKIQRAYFYAKQDVKIIFSKLWMQTTKMKDQLPNAKDREAWVNTQEEYIKAQRQEYEWQYNLKRAEIIFNRYSDIFVSVRKLASMMTQDKSNYDHGI